MRDVAFAFFLAAVLCVTAGMIWGLQMSASGDHSMVGAHAHLNLVGWATMALFGIYYRLTPQAAQGWLAKVHAVLAIVGVAVMVPGIAIAISGGLPGLAIAGSLLTFASMAVFLFTVVRHGFGASADSRRGLAGAALTPAE
jgi:peptidoglycan/LPS O-acetylase OafA/YrhL